MNNNNVVIVVCVFIVFPSDGTKLRRVEGTPCLGHQITERMHIRYEIQHKMNQTLSLAHLVENECLFKEVAAASV